MFKPKAETILETPTKSVSTVVDTVNWLPTHEHIMIFVIFRVSVTDF